MAEFGIMIAEKLIEAIESDVIKEVCKVWGYETQFEDLKKTVTTIQKVLVDAEAIRELSNERQHYISELKGAVYDADDLFDELRTLFELKEIQPLTKTGKIKEKVRRFFSSKKQVGLAALAYRLSRDFKDIKKRLDGIIDNHHKYWFSVDSVDYKPIARRREETCSYVYANGIIGRNNDKEVIVDMLLNPYHNNNGEDFVAVTVVGVGGLGKTALAQLVFNDERIEKEFHASKFWVCVSDQDGVPFDVKTILFKILEVVNHQKFDGSSPMELVHQKFQETLRGKKYLLVLDDVWNEDPKKWDELKQFLILGQSGSRVVVTTRSKKTGTILGEKHAYELEGLSQDDSWLLFQMSAFDDITDKPENHHEFVEIGKKIVAKCYNIPLVLKVVGSLLFGQRISKWRSFEDAGLAHIGEGPKGYNKIFSILKLSYYNLARSVKCCFAYCALFPKDYEFEKQNLIDLWIAQGYITPLNVGQSVEDAAEEYFLILLRRCFFQNVVKDEYGEIVSVKIHALMHDVAQEVGREEFCVVTSLADIPGDKIRHVRYEEEDTTTLKRPLRSSKIRSFIHQHMVHTNCVVTQIDNWMCLRVLDLSSSYYDCGFEKLPKSIGKLLHLRYLNLSNNNNLTVLSNEITKLHNLQTLLLCNCHSLRELPKDFTKLVNLRHLDLQFCDKIQCMPRGMGKMTSLKVLPYYLVNVLKALTGIRGGMEIEIEEIYEEKEEGVIEREGVGGYLKGTDVVIGRDHNRDFIVSKLSDSSTASEALSIASIVGTGGEGKTTLARYMYDVERMIRCFDVQFWVSATQALAFEVLLSHMETAKEFLANFRHHKLWQMIQQDSRLARFWKTTNFVGSEDFWTRIEKLKQRRRLFIFELENVNTEVDALANNLQNEEYLEELVLEWSVASDDPGNARLVLTALKPHTTLTRLTIKNYQGTSLPDWVGNSAFCGLRTLQLHNCPNCISLPSLGKLPSLVYLSIKNFENLETVGPEFYGDTQSQTTPFQALQTLHFEDLPEWQTWVVSEFEGQTFPILRELCLIECSQLVGKLPAELVSLRKLEILECEKLHISLPCLPKITDLQIQNSELVDLASLASLSSLTSLDVFFGEVNRTFVPILEKLTRLTNLRIAGHHNLCNFEELQFPSTLETLFISHPVNLHDTPLSSYSSDEVLPSLHLLRCMPSSLTSLSIGGFRDLNLPKYSYNSLQYLSIHDCYLSEPSRFPLGEFVMLEYLDIKNCFHLESFDIASILGHEISLPFLNELSIDNCPHFLSFPKEGIAAPNLRTLSITSCKSLLSLPEGMRTRMTSLLSLSLKECPDLNSLPKDGLPSSLQTLCITYCKRLTSNWKQWNLQQLVNLKRLEIQGCEEVECFPPEGWLPAKLTTLVIAHFPALAFLIGESLRQLTSLQELEIMYCQELWTLPEGGLPPFLKYLGIYFCPLLKEKCQRDVGEDWPKISHLPHVNIDFEEI